MVSYEMLETFHRGIRQAPQLFIATNRESYMVGARGRLTKYTRDSFFNVVYMRC